MFKILPKQSFTSNDKATAIAQAQNWLAEQSEGGAYEPLHIQTNGTVGHLTLSGLTSTSMIVFIKKG